MNNMNNMNTCESDNEEQEYDWENASFSFSDDERFDEVVDVEAVRAYAKEQTCKAPLPIISFCDKIVIEEPKNKKTTEEEMREMQELQEIEEVKEKLSRSSWGKTLDTVVESDSDSDSDSDNEEEFVKKVEKIDLDFPTLGQSLTMKVQKHNTDLSEGWTSVNKVKNKVAQVLSDPLKIGKFLQKTQMCDSVKRGSSCRHGQNCRYAHTPEELVIGECVYGSECRFVMYIHGVCRNSGSKICTRKHPKEQIDEYYYRTCLKSRPLPTIEEMDKEFENFLASSPVKVTHVKKDKPFVFKKFENVQNKPKKTAIVEASRKFVTESLEKQKIKERVEINARIKEINISMGRKHETIDRFKKMSPLTEFYKKQIKKLEAENLVYKDELKTLDEKLKAVDSMKKVEVKQQIPVVKSEEVIEKKTENPVVKEVLKQEVSVVLVLPKKPVEVKPIEIRRVDIVSEVVKQPVEVKSVVLEEGWTEVNKVKTKAFIVAEEKQKLTKTKMCTFGKDCNRGKACRFAHSKDELLVNTCIFGNACKFVKRTVRGFENEVGWKICTHRHPEEHINNFYYRVGIDKVPVRSQPQTIPRPVVISKPKENIKGTNWSNIVVKK